MRLLTGTVLLVTGGMAATILSAIAGLIVARTLGPVDFGRYSVALALPTAFVYTFLLGLDAVATREVAKCPESSREVLPGTVLPGAGWSLMLSGVVFGVGYFLGYPFSILALLAISILIVALQSIANLLRAIIRGFERMDLDVAVQLTQAGTGLVLIGTVLGLGLSRSAFAALLALLVASLVALALAAAFSLGLAHRPCRYDRALALSLIKIGLPICVAYTVVGLNLRIETLALSLLASEKSVGLYSAAFGVMVFSTPIGQLAAASLLPRMSLLAGQATSDFILLWEKGLRYTVIVGGAIAGVIGIAAPVLVNVLYGWEYAEAVPALRLLAITGALLFVDVFLRHALIACGMERGILFAALVGLVVAILLSLMLIPRFGIVGAALATIVRECCMIAILGYAMGKSIPSLPWAKAFLSPVVACLALLPALWVVRPSADWRLLLVLPPALVVYLVILRATKGISSQEANAIWSTVVSWVSFHR
jgi:O-antigen/teichoic acid export membrane protein